MKPYAYVIHHIFSDMFYVGSRYGYDADPADLWVTYFTSSKIVWKLLETDGSSSFNIIQLTEVSTPSAALELEGQLQLSYPRKQLLNRRLNNTKFNVHGPHSPEHCANISKGKSGKTVLKARGKIRSAEHCAAISATRTGQPYKGDALVMGAKVSRVMRGRILTEQHCQNISKSRKGRNFSPQTPEHIAKRVAARKETLERRKETK